MHDSSPIQARPLNLTALAYHPRQLSARECWRARAGSAAWKGVRPGFRRQPGRRDTPGDSPRDGRRGKPALGMRPRHRSNVCAVYSRRTSARTATRMSQSVTSHMYSRKLGVRKIVATDKHRRHHEGTQGCDRCHRAETCAGRAEDENGPADGYEHEAYTFDLISRRNRRYLRYFLPG